METVLSARKALISIQGLRIEAEEFTLSEKAKRKNRGRKNCKLAGVYLKKKNASNFNDLELFCYLWQTEFPKQACRRLPRKTAQNKTSLPLQSLSYLA